MRLATLNRSAMRLLAVALLCAGGGYGAGLLSMVVHEAGHAVAVRMTGGRVLELGIDATLRGRSHPLSYYPFVESIGYFDRYWVAFGGFVATVALGLIGSLLVVNGRRRPLLAGVMLVGTTFGCIGVGALRFAITGAPSEAEDLFLFSHPLGLSLGAFRWVVGSFGAATVGACALLVSVGLRRFFKIHGVDPTSVVRNPLLPASMIVSVGLTFWFFGLDRASVLIVCIVLGCGSPLAWRLSRLRAGSEAVILRTDAIASQAVGLLTFGVVSLGAMRLLVPGDAHREPGIKPRGTEHSLRLAAYWSSERGDDAGALKYLEEARQRFDSVGLRYDLGTRYRVAGRTQDAVRLLSEACGSDPLLEPCWAQLAKAYEEAKSFDQAASAWKTAAALEQQAPDSRARARRIRVMLQRAAALGSTAPPS